MYAIVVGGSSGFGKNISDALRVAGYRVTTIGRKNADVIADVGDEGKWKEIVKSISEHEHPISAAVFVVGHARAQTGEIHDEASWKEHEQKNIGYVRQALEHFVFDQHARVVTIGSQWSWKRGNEELGPYIESKHALRELTEQFASLHPECSVSHVCPPSMRTAPLEKLLKEGYRPPNGEIADPAVVAKAMVDQMLTKEFHGETLQFNKEGGAALVSREHIETEPRYMRR